MTENTFYDADIGEAIDRWNTDNLQEGSKGVLVAKAGKLYDGFIVDEEKDGVKTGNKIKVYHFYVQVGKHVRKLKFGKETMQKWESKHGSNVKKWEGKEGFATFSKVGTTKYIVFTPAGTLDKAD